MKAEAEQALAAENGYWLVPLANFLGGLSISREYVAHGLQQLAKGGIPSFLVKRCVRAASSIRHTGPIELTFICIRL